MKVKKNESVQLKGKVMKSKFLLELQPQCPEPYQPGVMCIQNESEVPEGWQKVCLGTNKGFKSFEALTKSFEVLTKRGAETRNLFGERSSGGERATPGTSSSSCSLFLAPDGQTFTSMEEARRHHRATGAKRRRSSSPQAWLSPISSPPTHPPTASPIQLSPMSPLNITSPPSSPITARPPSSPSPPLPQGWSTSSQGKLLPPSSLSFQFPTLTAAFLALAEDTTRFGQRMNLFRSLALEGWKIGPSKWKYHAQPGGGFHFLTFNGLFFASENKFLNHLKDESSKDYDKDDASRLVKFIKEQCGMSDDEDNNIDLTGDDESEENVEIIEVSEGTKSEPNQVEELKQKLATVEEEHRRLQEVLRERVECPVCMDLPTSGPLHSCPNGHLVCSSCYPGPASPCPSCRATMGATRPLLAVTVIEAIQHPCAYLGCVEAPALGEVAGHKGRCGWRPVACPAACQETLPFCQVVAHLQWRHCLAVRRVEGDSCTFRAFPLETLTWRDKTFFLTLRRNELGLQLYVQMLGAREECGAVEVVLTLHKEEGRREGRHTMTVCEEPYPAQLPAADRPAAGLVVGRAAVDRLVTDSPSGHGFYVTVAFTFV